MTTVFVEFVRAEKEHPEFAWLTRIQEPRSGSNALCALLRERRTIASQMLLLNEDPHYDNVNNGVCPERFNPVLCFPQRTAFSVSSPSGSFPAKLASLPDEVGLTSPDVPPGLTSWDVLPSITS